MAKEPSTDVATTAKAGEVAEISDIEAALIADNQASLDAADLVIPMLKVGQPLTDEVSSGDASPGEFINALTREGLGNKIEFVVAGYAKGRFRPSGGPGERVKVAYNTNTVPWTDDPFNGLPFSEHPDAEEKWRERSNAGEIEWGDGPPIRTTYNFTGYIVSDGEDEPIPVRLSLMRTNAPAARKWATILNAVLRGRYWDSVFEVSTEQTKGERGNYYTVTVKQARKTTPEEKQRAVELAVILKNQTVRVAGEDALEEKPGAQPEAAGGIEV